MPALVVVAAFQMQHSVALIGLDLHHDTFMFDAARRLLDGELPFRDFFYQYNLATVFFHAFALKMLGTQIASLKVATAVSYAGIAVLIYISVAVIRPGRWALAAALLWSVLSPFYMPALNGYHAWSTVYMMTAVMGGAVCLAMALTDRPILWALLAGVCFNLAFWFKQVAGLQILVLLAWIVYNALRSPALDSGRRFQVMFFGIALGGLVSSIPFFAYLYQHSLFEDWWRSAFVFNGFFAASGHSASGLAAVARTFLPVTRELGYISLVWALLPLCLVAILFERQPAESGGLFLRSGKRNFAASLFVTLSIAGWLEYFPLAHAFHTHLFMAPMFVLLAWCGDRVTLKPLLVDRGNWPLMVLLVLTGVTLVYEAARHLHGFREKTSQPTVTLKGKTPASGLRLTPDNARAFTAYYDAMLATSKAAAESQLVPMSVDPLRALLPYSNLKYTDFKMGVNWTWPNEIVESGFNKRLARRIAERKAPIYADSLIGVPGYLPVALLEMESPITASHTLYAPSADPRLIEPPTNPVVGGAIYLSSKSFPIPEQSAINQVEQPLYLNLFRLVDVNGIDAEDVAHLHVSIARPVDFPAKLSKFQYEYFVKAVPGSMAARVAELYESHPNGHYELKWPLEHGQTLDLAKFMLSQGKLFEDLNRPMFFTTLASTPDHRPFLAKKKADEDEMRIYWARSWFKGLAFRKTKPEVSTAYFLAIPAGVVHMNEEAVLYVQVVKKDNTTRNFYLHYIPT